MTRRRWIADEYSSQIAALTGANAAHLARTLRARVGSGIRCCLRRVCVSRDRVIRQSTTRVEFALGNEVLSDGDARPVTLLLAVFKFDRMEWAIEKCTELNVTTIVPVIARRTEKHLAQAAEKRVERWRRIAHEAAQQSRRLAAPEIASAQKLTDALQLEAEAKIVLAENERGTTLNEILRSRDGDCVRWRWPIGPQGGWATTNWSFRARRIGFRPR